MGQVVMFAGSKAGTGKTTASIMTALVANKLFKQRILVIDATTDLVATKTLLALFKQRTQAKLTTGLTVKQLGTVITPLRPQLDLIPSAPEIESYFETAVEAEATTQTQRTTSLMPPLVAELKQQYDYILIDTGATFALTFNNCLASTDYVVVMQPTGSAGFHATDRLFYYLKQLKEIQTNVTAEIVGHLSLDLTNPTPFYAAEPVSSFDVADSFHTVITKNDWLAANAPFTAAMQKKYAGACQLAGVMYSEIFNELRARIELQQKLGQFATPAGLTAKGKAIKLFSE